VEIAAFNEFTALLAAPGSAGDFDHVVFDTAPTGHTLLLLDALADPGKTQILLVTLPEATPVHEARALQADLKRAGITPYGWVINSALAGTPPPTPCSRPEPRPNGTGSATSKTPSLPGLPSSPGHHSHR
jgi:arsenite-transporting ATPase